jgi:tetratricopeptide (TPR) repeat protein
VTDPAGLIARIPELEVLAEDPRVRRAIERGDPHGLYRVLFWANLTGRMRKHRETIRMLLARRRLFLAPLKSAPRLFTYNGVGMTVYGTAEPDHNDGTYITTHYVVFLFFPVVPLRQFLVRNADSARGRAWNFIGKVPFSPLAFVWNRMLALLVIGGVLAGGVSTLRASRYHVVHFVNATPLQVRAQVAGKTVTVEPDGLEQVTVPVGRQRVVVTRGDGTPMETQEIDVRRGADVQVFNVLGAGLVYRELVVYKAEGARAADVAQDDPQVGCGETFVRLDDATDVFVDPPAKISMPSSSTVSHRSHIGFARASGACLSYLVQHDHVAQAAALAQRTAEATSYSRDALFAAATLIERSGGKEAALAFVQKALAAEPDNVDVHRLYQDMALADGKRAELLQAYQKRRDEKPEDPDSVYLVARLQSPSQAAPALDDLCRRFPKHVAARRAQAFDQYQTGHFEAAVSSWHRVAELAPQEREENLSMLVRALVATSRSDEALREIESLFEDKEARRTELAELYARVVHASGRVREAETLFERLDKDEPAALLAWRRARARMPEQEGGGPSGASQQYLRDAVALIVSARSGPDEALQMVGNASAQALVALDEDTWGLLYAEAARRDPTGKATQALAAAAHERGEAQAVQVFVAKGESSLDFEELPFEVRAAAELVRARDPGLPAAERKKLLAAARRDDLLHGAITAAINGWKSGR